MSVPSKNVENYSRPLSATWNGHQIVNPKKWSLNHQTGEYERVTFRYGKAMLVDKSTRNERHTNRLQAIWLLRLFSGATFLSLLLLYFQFDVYYNSDRYNSVLVVFVWIFLLIPPACLIVSLANVSIAIFELLRPSNQLGPAPIPLPGYEQVEDQKAYGDAKVAGLHDIHAALSGALGKPPGSATPQGIRFED